MTLYEMYGFAQKHGEDGLEAYFAKNGGYASEPHGVWHVDLNEVLKFTFWGSSHSHCLEWKDIRWREGHDMPPAMQPLVEAAQSWLAENKE